MSDLLPEARKPRTEFPSPGARWTYTWRQKHKARVNIYNRGTRAHQRLALLRMVGLTCARCGESDLPVLHIDHIIPRPTDTRSRGGPGTQTLLSQLRSGKDRLSNLQTLCANCHMRKTREDHSQTPPPETKAGGIEADRASVLKGESGQQARQPGTPAVQLVAENPECEIHKRVWADFPARPALGETAEFIGVDHAEHDMEIAHLRSEIGSLVQFKIDVANAWGTCGPVDRLRGAVRAALENFEARRALGEKP